MKQALTRVPVLLAAAIVAACAVDGSRDESRGTMASNSTQPAGHGRSLPAWHPPVMRMPALPDGHPPVPGWHPALPQGHPACPALGNAVDGRPAGPVLPRPNRVDVVRT